MSDMFLRPDGVLLWRPDAETRAGIRARGGYVIASGQLCTACLVGSWPSSMLRVRQTLCSGCARLEAEVSRRAGLAESKSAAQWRGGVIVFGPSGGIEGDDGGEDVVRRSRAYRAERLYPVFVHARALGIVLLEEGKPGTPPAELLPTDVLREHGLIPESPRDRAERYVAWLRALDPAGYARRAEVLADVDALARLREEYDR